MLQGIENYLLNNRERLQEELFDILKLPTYHSADESVFKSCQKLIINKLEGIGFTTSLLPCPGRSIIFAQLKGSRDKSILFYNHYDVVPPGEISLWKTNPFIPTIIDKDLYCRGISDHKGSLMARIHAIEAMLALGGKLPITVKFIIEAEEEDGSPYLAQIARENLDLLSADGCLYPGWRRDENDKPRINLGSRGSLTVELRCQTASRDLHEAYASLVPNALTKIICSVASLFDQKQRIRIEGFYDNIYSNDLMVLAAERIDFDAASYKKKIGAPLLLGEPADNRALCLQNSFKPTISVVSIKASSNHAKDVLPSEASARIRFLLVPKQDANELVGLLRKHLDAEGFVDVSVTPLNDLWESSYTPVDDPFVKTVLEAGRVVYGQEPTLVPVSSGSGPKYVFSSILGIPTIADVGVGNSRSNDHGINECIEFKDYFRNIEHIALIIHIFSKS